MELTSSCAASQRYPSSLQQDEEVLKGTEPLSQRKRWAVQVRVGEKRLLREMKRSIIKLAMHAAQEDEDGSYEDDGDDESGEDNCHDDNSDCESDGEHSADAAVARPGKRQR